MFSSDFNFASWIIKFEPTRILQKYVNFINSLPAKTSSWSPFRDFKNTLLLRQFSITSSTNLNIHSLSYEVYVDSVSFSTPSFLQFSNRSPIFIPNTVNRRPRVSLRKLISWKSKSWMKIGWIEIVEGSRDETPRRWNETGTPSAERKKRERKWRAREGGWNVWIVATH